MAELPDHLHDQIQQLCAEGDDFLDRRKYDIAVARYSAAWNLLPNPPTDWEAATWILGAMADAHFQNGDFTAMRQPLMTVMQCEGATGNPFLRLRLGQCLFELGELDEAANWLAGAYLEEGKRVFEQDDPKYLEFIKSKLEPPPNGWPEGW